MEPVKIAKLRPAPADFMRRFAERLGEYTFRPLEEEEGEKGEEGKRVEIWGDDPLGRVVLGELVGCYVSEFWSVGVALVVLLRNAAANCMTPSVRSIGR